MQKIKRMRKGFLLPDVMIAVFVTATALVAILAALAPLLKSEFFKRDEIIATGLAQEGIELVRNTREANWKNSVPAFNKSTDTPAGVFPVTDTTTDDDGGSPLKKPLCKPTSGTLHCGDFSSGISDCGVGSSEQVLHNNSGVYEKDGSGETKFKRTIMTCKTSDNKSTRVVHSIVTWGSGASAHTVTLKDTLYNWGDK